MDNYVFILLFVTLIATLTFAFFTRKKQKSTLYSLFRVLFLLLSLHVVALILLFYFKDIILNMDTLMYIDAISYISTCNLPVILFFISSIYENKETNLTNIQKLAKILVFGTTVYTGEEKDQNATITIKK